MNIDNIDNNAKPIVKRSYVMTDKRREAIERMQKARREKLAAKRSAPVLKRSNAEDGKEVVQSSLSSSSSSSSSETDSENYESDKDIKPVIISGYDKEEPETKIKITRVRRRDRSNELKQIYQSVKQEEEKPKTNKGLRRMKVLDAYYERNKDNYIAHDGELEEFKFSQDEWDAIHSRFSSYEKEILKNKLTKKRVKKN